MRGVSSIIAMVLVLMISVSLVSFGYVFFTKVAEETTASAKESSKRAFSIIGADMKVESVSGDKIYVRNTGSTNLSGFIVYVNDVVVGISDVSPETIQPGETATITLASPPVGSIEVYSSQFGPAEYYVPGAPPCGDGNCEPGESCPADASDCPDNRCYEPTCVSGCGESFVASGGTDEACNAGGGCASPPCYCDGSGNCISGAPPAGLVGFWEFEEGSGFNVGDSSPSGNDGTLSGDGDEWYCGRIGTTGLEFDGSGDYVNIGNPLELQLTGDMTISFWAYPANIAEHRENPIDKAYCGEFALTQETGGSLSYYQGPNGGETGGYMSRGWGGIFVNNQWVHVVLVRDMSEPTDSRIRLYKDGADRGIGCTPPCSWADPSVSSEPVTIGDGYAGSGFHGFIDDVRIYDYALTASDVLDLYNAAPPECKANGDVCTYGCECCDGNCTAGTCGPVTTCGTECSEGFYAFDDGTHTWDTWPSVCMAKIGEGQQDCDCDQNCQSGLYCDQIDDPPEDYCCPIGEEWDGDSCELPSTGLVGFWKFDGDATDSSGNGNDGTVSGATFTSDSISGEALDFGGIGYVGVVDDPTLDITDELTVEAWVKMDSFTQTGYILSKNYDYGVQMSYAVYVYNNGEVIVYLNHTSWSTGYIMPIGEWRHVAVTWNGTDVVLYVNGNFVNSASRNFVLTPNDYRLCIGCRNYNGGPGTSYEIDGIMDEIKLYDIALTQAEIQQEYQSYMVGYWKFDEGSGSTTADSSGNGNDGTLYGGLDTTGWTTDCNSGNCLDFDGLDDYVDLGTMDVSGDEMTIMAWFKADDFGVSDGRIISKATGQAEQAHWWMLSTIDSAGNMRLRFRLKTGTTPSSGTTTLIASSGNLNNDWIHAAAVYNGTHMIIYKDGDPVGITTKSGNIATDNTVSAWIGDNPGPDRKQFDGIIDEVKIFDRALTQAEIQAEM